MRGILWCLFFVCGSALVQAQTPETDFEFDFTYPSEALSIVGVYANDDSSCIQVMITGQGARRQEFRATGDIETAVIEVPLPSLCFVVFSNLDRNKQLELRLSPEIENVAQLSDRQLINTGIFLFPSNSTSIVIRAKLSGEQKIMVTTGFLGRPEIEEVAMHFTLQ